MVKAGEAGKKEGLYLPVVWTLLSMKKETQFQLLGSVKIRGFWKGSQKAPLRWIRGKMRAAACRVKT